VLTGGAQADTFDLTRGGTDTVHGGDGNDTFTLGATLTAADGGTGIDTVSLDGDYSAGLTFTATTLTNVESLILAGDTIDGGAGSDVLFIGATYSGSFSSISSVEELVLSGANDFIVVGDGLVAAGATLTIDSTNATGFTFNGASETDGFFSFLAVPATTYSPAVRRPIHSISAAAATMPFMPAAATTRSRWPTR
jgi:hypothetical protein